MAITTPEGVNDTHMGFNTFHMTQLCTSDSYKCNVLQYGGYRLHSGKFFCEAEIFVIFVIKHQLAKISSGENFFLQKFYADDELRKPSTLSSSRRTSNLTEN